MELQRQLFGIRIDALDMAAAVARIREWIRQPGDRCRYVVTPNVDHAVQLRENEQLKSAYEEADLVLADGQPIVWASYLLGQPVPERVAGSDLVPALFSHVAPDETLNVFLLGAAEGVAERAAENIQGRWPQIKVIGTYSPPPGFEHDLDECEFILQRIAVAKPDVLVVGLGAPKQECWVYRHRKKIEARVVLCVGAAIDFLAGEQTRAPKWMQKTGTEWLFRIYSDPKRLAGRYARDALVFPQLVFQQWMSSRRRGRS